MTAKENASGVNTPEQSVITQPLTKANVALRGFIGGTLTIILLGAVGTQLDHLVLIAPFGASCVLLFAAPESPFAQPRNLMGGHLITASTGMLMLWLLGHSVMAAGVAVGLVIALMELTRTVHPPAGANPIVIMLSGKVSLTFLLAPILLGVGLLLLMALVINNVGGRRWPVRWW